MLSRSLFCWLGVLVCSSFGVAQQPKITIPNNIPLEEQPTDPKKAKIVLIAGSNYFKPGEHEYVAGCAVLLDLLRQTPEAAPVLAIDWPKNPETFDKAKAIVFLFDGGDKHALLKENRIPEIQKLVDAGVGLVALHQVIDVPKDLGDRVRGWMGGAWEAKFSQRAHWVSEFKTFPDHPVSRGVQPFQIDDGWLFKIRFVKDLKGVTPFLKTPQPKVAQKQTEEQTVVSWLYERPDGGRSFTFTGCHLHSSFAEEGYRRFLTNGILWTAKIEIPKSGASVELNTADLAKYLAPSPTPKKTKK